MKKLGIGIITLLLVIGLTGCEDIEREETKKENNTAKKTGDVFLKLVCTHKEEKQKKSGNKTEIETSIELNIDNDVLMKKTETTTWKDPEKETCTFYTKRAEIYNGIKGMKDTVECTAEGGVRKTVVIFEELDEKQARIAEQKYIREDKTFDKDSYKTFRWNEGYRCSEYEGGE